MHTERSKKETEDSEELMYVDSTRSYRVDKARHVMFDAVPENLYATAIPRFHWRGPGYTMPLHEPGHTESWNRDVGVCCIEQWAPLQPSVQIKQSEVESTNQMCTVTPHMCIAQPSLSRRRFVPNRRRWPRRCRQSHVQKCVVSRPLLLAQLTPIKRLSCFCCSRRRNQHIGEWRRKIKKRALLLGREEQHSYR